MVSGGDLVYLYAEQVCTWDGTDCNLHVTLNDNLAGLPQEIQMTDNGDGTYSAPLTVNDVGTLSVSAKVFYEGLMGTYSMSGYTIVEYNEGLRHDWGTGAINGFVYSADTIEVLWEGFVLPPADLRLRRLLD